MLVNLRHVLSRPSTIIGLVCMAWLLLFNKPTSMYYYLTLAQLIFGMIYNTAVGMFFSFAARFAESGTQKFKTFFTITMIVGYFASYVGFTGLVSYFYPLIGYLGIILILALVAAPFIIKKQEAQ